MREIRLKDGTVELIKWVGLALMTVDHVNTYLFDSRYQWAYSLGRLVVPLFALVLAYNLSRPGVINNATGRIMSRMIFFGLLATPAVAYLHGKFLPVNILFTLAFSTALVWTFATQGYFWKFVALLGLTGAGFFMEGYWPTPLLVLSLWYFFSRWSFLAIFGISTSLVLLSIINKNPFALVTLPIIRYGLGSFDAKIPRMKFVFYAYYPLHLTAIAVWKWM